MSASRHREADNSTEQQVPHSVHSNLRGCFFVYRYRLARYNECMSKVIVCVDMDAFFASVEQRDNLGLRGKPIAVIGAGVRTVITTCSYEARTYRVKTGMTINQAKQLCPQITFIVGRNRRYAEICRKLEQICLRFTPDTEVYSIDEVFLDITGSCHLFGGPEATGRLIKQTVRKDLGLNCTVGIGPNIMIAKLASDLAKPDGFMWITEDAASTVLEKLSVKKLWGVGSHTEKKLRTLGITTCGQLARASEGLLTKTFGVMGTQLKAMGNGTYERTVISTSVDPKSIGHSITFPEDLWSHDDLSKQLLLLSEKVGRRARRYGHKGKKITLTVRYSDFKTFTKQSSLSVCTNDTSEIYQGSLAILDRIHLKRAVRLLGISLSDISKDAGQMSLFEESTREKKAALLKAVDTVNDKFGERKVTWASTANEENKHGVISPAWRPSGVRKSEMD